jgi:hypothetical protein
MTGQYKQFIVHPFCRRCVSYNQHIIHRQVIGVKRILPFLLLLSLTAYSAQRGFGSRRQDPDAVKREHDQMKALNKERVKEIQNDTNKLLDLATELKKSVDAAGDNTLSLEVIRKTDEIEKLSKKVREKMKETYTPPDTTHLPDAGSRR